MYLVVGKKQQANIQFCFKLGKKKVQKHIICLKMFVKIKFYIVSVSSNGSQDLKWVVKTIKMIQEVGGHLLENQRQG